MSHQSASLLFQICVFNRCKHDLSHKQIFHLLSSLALLARKTFLYRCDYVRDFWEKYKASSTASSWLTLNCAERFDDVIHVHSSRDSATADVSSQHDKSICPWRCIATSSSSTRQRPTGGCDVTTSDVTERSTDGWFSDKLVDFCVRSLDDATPCCEFIVSARLPHVHTGAWNKGVRCNIIDDTVVTSQCTRHSSYM